MYAKHTKQPKSSDLTLLLVGKTGNGKSSTANTILQAGTVAADGGENTRGDSASFAVAHSFNSATISMEWQECTIDGRKIMVINTPDLANPVRTDEGKVLVQASGDTADDSKTGEKVPVDVDKWANIETKRWLTQTGGKPSAVVLVIRCDMRYTKEEFAIFTQLKEKLGENMKGNLVIVFTMGDLFGGDMEKTLKDVCDELKKVLKAAKNRYVIFDNKSEDPEKKKQQVRELLKVVDGISGNM